MLLPSCALLHSVCTGRHGSTVDSGPPLALASSDTHHPTAAAGGPSGGEGPLLSPTPFSSSLATLPTVTAYSRSLSYSDTEETIAFDVQPIQGRLPQSSYTEGDSLFTWTDITGTYTRRIYLFCAYSNSEWLGRFY